jgi:hypothetical protein
VRSPNIPIQSRIKLFATSRDPNPFLTNLAKLMGSNETTGRLQAVSHSIFHLDWPMGTHRQLLPDLLDLLDLDIREAFDLEQSLGWARAQALSHHQPRYQAWKERRRLTTMV